MGEGAWDLRTERQRGVQRHRGARQAEAEAEKAQRKQKRLREIDDWRKESSKRGRTMDKDDDKGYKGPRRVTKSKTNDYKDKKWGFGGLKKGSKKTTDRKDKSLSDLSDFNPSRGKTKGPRRGAKGGRGR